MPYKEISGIYKIVNKTNGKFYLGSSKSIHSRWSQHKKELRNNCHHSRYLQNAWNKYGEDAFSFEIYELINVEELIIKEQYYLDSLKPYDETIGYNILPTAGGGDTISKNPNREAIIEKLRISSRNAINNMSYYKKVEWKKKISNSLKGRVFSEEHSKHKSEAQMGEKNHQYGVKWSKERRKNQSESHKGKNSCQIMRKVCIYGVIYESVLSACRALNIKRHLMRYRLDSGKYKDYSYVKQP